VAQELETYYRTHADRTRTGAVTVHIPVIRHVLWLLTAWTLLTGLPILAS
jgi:hypothetical protein